MQFSDAAPLDPWGANTDGNSIMSAGTDHVPQGRGLPPARHPRASKRHARPLSMPPQVVSRSPSNAIRTRSRTTRPRQRRLAAPSEKRLSWTPSPGRKWPVRKQARSRTDRWASVNAKRQFVRDWFTASRGRTKNNLGRGGPSWGYIGASDKMRADNGVTARFVQNRRLAESAAAISDFHKRSFARGLASDGEFQDFPFHNSLSEPAPRAAVS